MGIEPVMNLRVGGGQLYSKLLSRHACYSSTRRLFVFVYVYIEGFFWHAVVSNSAFCTCVPVVDCTCQHHGSCCALDFWCHATYMCALACFRESLYVTESMLIDVFCKCGLLEQYCFICQLCCSIFLNVFCCVVYHINGLSGSCM